VKEEIVKMNGDNGEVFDLIISDYLTIIDYSPVLHYLLITGHRVSFDEIYDKFGSEVIEDLDNLLDGRMITKYTKKNKTHYTALTFDALVYIARTKGNIK
jgi:hypothetical protein